MNPKKLFIGNTKASFERKEVKGEYITIENELFYKISNSDAIRPFFMSIVSDSNHWMFVSSNGGISAGRKNSDLALFPYYTEDKITESAEITGSKSIFLVQLEEKIFLWEPFSTKYEGLYSIKRNLYKNIYGNKIIFEEINKDLGLSFQYEWNSSNLYGFVRKSVLKNHSKFPCRVTLLDGIQNILPNGLSSDLQNSYSNLADAYKKNELEAESGLAIFALSAIIVDKPEPSESLKANIAWSAGIENTTYLISSLQLSNFEKGLTVIQETEIKAEKGAYFISTDIILKAGSEKRWIIVANVNQGPGELFEIAEKLKSKKELTKAVLADVDLGTENLIKLSAAADGLQLTNDPLQNTRHFSNILFNIMRGGIFDNNYQIESGDFKSYISKANKILYAEFDNLLKNLPAIISLHELNEIASQNQNTDFKRLCYEYMPLKFSRRHGDPSRPWNKFSINTRNEIDGSKILDYQGNWRDIFQNWEALSYSYPEFINGMIHKFLNASTFEGYNPYRVTKDGFDWEVIEPNDPWSFIGYWGDHQIVYLLKFLEFSENVYPDKLADFFELDIFVFANVPYKIKSYSDILNKPKDTIVFDHKLDHLVNERKKELGADGALLRDRNDSICKVNLIEKLLVTALAKVSNFIPEAGIWLNTQRPEWNDANNALVGNGVSMVTLYYLRRYILFFKDRINRSHLNEYKVSEELKVFFQEVEGVFYQYEALLAGKISDKDRKSIIDGLGNAGSNYRSKIYLNAHSGAKGFITKKELVAFFNIALKFFDHSIDANKRLDNLYHSYNLMTVENDNTISIAHLPLMLEGQVAVLASAKITSIESLALIYSLKKSELYREDQNSYILYPNKKLPRFFEKNNIPKLEVEKSDLLNQLIKDNNTQIIVKDILGNFHFNGNFNNAESLKSALNTLPETKYKTLVEKDKSLILNIFEKVFNHKSFTGRSGTFFGYEGLGSIYWHMVSKLLLSVQETCNRAFQNNEDEIIVQALISQYFDIKEGIGIHKTPVLYGAFPTDPYSHTPASKGAQQPGMTGQVKEDILCRFSELGISVKESRILFNPVLLRKEDFLTTAQEFKYYDIYGDKKTLLIRENELCITYCQTPIVYRLANENSVEIVLSNGVQERIKELKLNKNISRDLFQRSGKVLQVNVTFQKSQFEN